MKRRDSEHQIKGKVDVSGDQVTVGSLHGIDVHIWEVGIEYLVYVHDELCPLPVQKW